MASTTRQRLIERSHDLFYVHGFHAVGLDRILSEVGVTKTTFYNHFPSKEDLILEVLRWHDRWWKDTFRDMLRRHGGDTPRGQLLAVPAALEESFHQGHYNGCMFVNVAVNFPLLHDPPHVAAAEHKHAMEDILRELAGYAGADDAAETAQELAMVLEGAYVTRQITGREDTSRVAQRLVRSIVDRHIPTHLPAEDRT